MSGTERTRVEATIRHRAFSLVYQPIVHLDSGTISGVEALCRFNDGYPPDAWFEKCEHLGLAPAMDLAVIELALRDLDRLPPGYLSLNLSAASLSAPSVLCDALQVATARRPIVLELTEHAVVDDYEVAIEGLRLLRDAGMLLAVDDAGAGYSTLQHILRLAPDIIKLDRSITSGMDHDPARRALTNALVIFAAEIGASVVAEGIETERELAALRTTGVTRGQGYWLARPSTLPLPPLEYRPTPYPELVRGAVDVASPFHGDATWAVVAHGLLSSMACVSTAVDLLRDRDGALPQEEYRALCSVMQRQVTFVIDTLQDLVRGLPAGALEPLRERAAGGAR